MSLRDEFITGATTPSVSRLGLKTSTESLRGATQGLWIPPLNGWNFTDHPQNLNADWWRLNVEMPAPQR